MSPSISFRLFGTLPDGRTVEAWTLKGTGGLELEVLTYGGIVSRLLAPDRRGRLADVALGFGSLDGYLGDHPYFGATAGRVAGRISGGSFRLNGISHALPINDPPNHLHGGFGAMDKQLWRAEPLARPDGAPSLRLHYHSPDGEQGYPGAVDLAVTYTVTPSNAFVFETQAHAHQATPVSLTHHTYFNLGGESNGDILDHRLRIDSDASFVADERMTLLDRLEPLYGQAGDFRQEKRIGGAMHDIWRQHGDLYWIGEVRSRRPVAQLYDPASGRILEVSTTHTCLQFYAGGKLDGSLVGKSGRPYPAFGGVCLECQGYPNAIDPDGPAGFGDIVVSPDSPQHHVTHYAFSTDGAWNPPEGP